MGWRVYDQYVKKSQKWKNNGEISEIFLAIHKCSEIIGGYFGKKNKSSDVAIFMSPNNPRSSSSDDLFLTEISPNNFGTLMYSQVRISQENFGNFCPLFCHFFSDVDIRFLQKNVRRYFRCTIIENVKQVKR